MNIKLLSVSAILLFIFLSFQPVQSQNEAPAEWAKCAACHTIGGGKLIGPDLQGVTERRSEEWLLSFIRSSQTMINNGDEAAVALFEEYNKIPMPDNNLSDEQIKGILAYINNYDPSAQAAQEEVKPVVSDVPSQIVGGGLKEHYGPKNNRIIFIVFVILLLVFLFDLVVSKIVKAKWITITIILTSLWFIGEIVYVEAKALGRQHGYSPDQPVWFSHKVHAGQNQIDCLYCHSDAMDSKHAGIPGTDVCMNCHNMVKKGTLTGTEEIKKVLDSHESGVPIQWIQVHNLPDHVYFNHAQHVNAGLRDCTECHGPVEEMDRVVQVEDLSMGWCLDCHRRTEVNFKNNDYYSAFEQLHEEIKNGERFKVTVEDVGGTDCSACHY